MSASIVRAHGGVKNITGQKGEVMNSGLFITNTMVGKSMPIHEKYLPGLISQTTGIPRERPIMAGVLDDTKQGVRSKDVPELHKVHHVGKTHPQRYGQVPYAGPKY
jgi:hypothetical protein